MTRRILLSTLAASAAIVGTATTAHAQHGVSATKQAQRVVATYTLGAPRYAMPFPAIVTVADSAGTLVASARLKGEVSEQPLAVSVIDNDLVLQGETTHGILTLVLDKQATGTDGKVTSGRWALGTTEGKLRGSKSE